MTRSSTAAVLLAALCVGCGADDPSPGRTMPDASQDATGLYPEVVAILEERCSISRCHVGPILGGGLPLVPGGDHGRVLVDVPSCEYPLMDLVEPFEPDRSWLMLKLTAPFRPQLDPYATYIYFDSDPEWDPSERGCPDETDDGTPLFGQRMPATAPNTLTEEQLAIVQRWIEAGAPH